MSKRKYIAGLGFVANALSRGIEKLPEYHVEPENVPITEIQPHQIAPSVINEVSQPRGGCNSQQSAVKQTCGHSQKSTRMKHAEKK